MLGVKRETLYAYVSRGLLHSRSRGGRGRQYARADLQRLKARRDARAGHGAVAASALRWGEPVLDSAITEIRSDALRYREHDAVILARDDVSFERVAELLWTGVLPGEASWSLAPADAVARLVPRLRPVLTEESRPLDGLALLVPALAVRDRQRFDPGDEAALALARRLLPAMATGLALPRGRAAVEQAAAESTLARMVTVALGARPTHWRVALVEQALVLCADHGLNASTFAARVTASTDADVYACITAALATVSGPKHGGASDRIDALLSELGRPELAVRGVRERLRRGEGMPGFGHPLYAAGDPRAVPLLEGAFARRGRRPLAVLRALVEGMALAGSPPPSVDTALVAVAHAAGLVPGAATGIFAVGRAAGWVAHVLEQRAANFTLRPRARYVPATGPR